MNSQAILKMPFNTRLIYSFFNPFGHALGGISAVNHLNNQTIRKYLIIGITIEKILA